MWRSKKVEFDQKVIKKAQEGRFKALRLLYPLAPAIVSYALLSPYDPTAPLWPLPWLWLIPLLLWCGVALIFPFRGFLSVLILGIGANALVALANLYKINLNGMPITALDIYITSANPDALWQSLGIPLWFGWLLSVGAVILLASLFIILAKQLAPMTILSATSILATFLLTGAMADYFAERMYVYLKNIQANNNIALWNSDGVAHQSQVLGIVPFLVYSWKLEKETGSEFFKNSADAQDISALALTQTYKTYFERPHAVKPNIVMIHLESIFNPDIAFEVDKKIHSNLFEANEYTHLVDPMRVNTIGGGSWVSEFEAITGLDSRLFGYSGYYTHVSISPYIENALPNFLKRKGYATSAFVATSGVFYNTKTAFHRYGFDEFGDWKDLQLSKDWAAPDSELTAAFVKKSLDFDKTKPFFSYLVTMGAHSPYICHSFKSSLSFIAKFRSSDDWGMNCDLNEYLLLLKDSEKAVALVLDRLKEIERETGRPFVLMIYGDHQPYAFTKTWQFAQSRDYDGVRTSAPKNQTFMHLMSSTRTKIKRLEGEKPISLLPTLLSAFVADKAEEIYLLSNMHLFEKCGADLFQGVNTAGLFGGDTPTSVASHGHFNPTVRDPASIPQSCQTAQSQTLANQRNSGIVSTRAR